MKMSRIILTVILTAWTISSCPPELAMANQSGNIFPEKQELMRLIADAAEPHERFLRSDWGKRNPFNTSPLVTTSVPEKAPEPPSAKPPAKVPKLEGILLSQPKPSAILNDTVVGVGTAVAGFTVKSISADEVIVTNGSEDFSLKIESRFIEKTDPSP